MLYCGFNFLFSLVAILCINLLCAESFHMNKCVETERRALLKFKDALILRRGDLSSWKGEDCCKWEGISCHNLTGHVTSLDLQTIYYTKAFRGKLDSSICELQHLTSLNLGNNNLKGKIPKCIGSLGKLIELNLRNNDLVSVIPPTLRNLSNLQTLDLSYNYFMISNDLDWLSHLSNLRYLDLSFVNLTLAIDWLSSISKIPSLSELHLNNCGLHQVPPKSIPHLNASISLKYLNLGGNGLNSSILPWVINVSKVLTHLDLSHVNLTLAVHWSSSISKIPSLSELRLYSCGLHQVTPKSIPHLNASISLKSLDLGYNDFNSSIVPWVINVSKVLTHLDLSYNEIESLKYFRNMSQLQELKLNSNKLSGKLSDNIQQLCSTKNGLKNLDLSNNPFNRGTLPDFSCFLSLEALSLQNTSVVGPFPKSFVHMPSLALLDLSFNQLNGSQSLFEITKLVSLNTLDLSHNQLSGPFPHTIGQLSSLRTLILSSNKLNGVINEVHLSNLTQLKILDVSQNSLSFNLSSDWVPPFKLQRLYASSCILGPKFPAWLRHQEELQYLDISHSGVSDSFPKWFWKLSLSLEYLNVSHNTLKGTLPKSFSRKKVYYDYDLELYVWDFSFNHLNGSLPAFPELGGLFLSNNMFTGSLSSFCTSSSHSLIHLDMSSNLLEGQLSDCWGKFQSLEVLNLAENNLSGKIPNSFGALRQIESLHLNNNNFSGEIPSLIFCDNLQLIDVGHNNLQGTLPVWIGHHLHQLIILSLRANKLQGSIPTSMCNLSFLQVLDLSKNNITGEIPQCFDHIVALSNLTFPRQIFWYMSFINYVENEEYEIGSFNDKEILAWKGSDREYVKNLGLMTFIDLSCNHLTGEIPQSITKLMALASLNLSRNNLKGLIPKNIGHMKMLESLDLSSNYLSGRMPTSFSNLTFLSYMNLSFNNLEGQIPQSTQLQTFDSSSYVGNNRLCGPPLINLCPGDLSPTRSHATGEDEDKLITVGFYVSLVFGFFVGFWGVCGTLVIKTSWRQAYFKFFNNINDWIHVTLAVFVNRLKKRFQVED